MCTGFVKKGKDILAGFNLDIDPEVWDFKLYKTKAYFTVGIKVGGTVYFTHGVNREGHFSNLPYMNDFESGRYKAVRGRERIDLLTDRYIRNKYSYEDVRSILDNKTVVNIPNGSMHTLLTDREGRTLIIEPGLGYREAEGDYAVIANFPLLKEVERYEPYFGKEKYDRANDILSAADDSFTPEDGMKLLYEVRQEGMWATRISFVYSRNEGRVYYALDNRFDDIMVHTFA